MWRNLIRTLESNLVLNSKNIATKSTRFDQTINNCSKVQCTNTLRLFHHTGLRLRNKATVNAVPESTEAATFSSTESIDEYIVPYREEYEKLESPSSLLDALNTRFRLTEDNIAQILNDDLVAKNYRKKSYLATLDALCMEKITRGSFVECPWVLTLDKKRVLEKINLLKSVNGFQDINDFVPFLRLQVPRLRKLIAALNREAEYIEYGNRVYYIAEKLQTKPRICTKYLVKRLFVLEMPWDMFQRNLQHMLDYDIGASNILKDLWAFRYAPQAVELRLRRAKKAKKDKIMPWMVRCPEPILQKSLQLSLDELEVLGNKTSAAEYIAERLGFEVEQAQAIMDKHPQVNTVRVTKIKEILDYLLDEAGFTRFEIASVPRVLCHSLETTKQRFEELKTYGCRPSSLIILCRSQREYEKFLAPWQQMYKKDNKPKGKNHIRAN